MACRAVSDAGIMTTGWINTVMQDSSKASIRGADDLSRNLAGNSNMLRHRYIGEALLGISIKAIAHELNKKYHRRMQQRAITILSRVP